MFRLRSVQSGGLALWHILKPFFASRSQCCKERGPNISWMSDIPTTRTKCGTSMHGWKLQNKSAFPSEKCLRDLPVRHYFLPVLDRQADSNFQNFSLSFGKVSKIFTCPAQFLPVPDRRTVCNFHPYDYVNCSYLQFHQTL